MKHLNFERLGQILDPESIAESGSHAAYPVAICDGQDQVKIFFTRRNAKNQSYIVSMNFGWKNGTLYCIDNEPTKVIQSIGNGFDKDGISMGNIVEIDGIFYLYALGWNLQTDVPWRNTIGLVLAKSVEGPFRKIESNPIIPISPINPHSMSYPWTIQIGKEYHCYFGSNGTWGKTLNDMNHVIKKARSKDGRVWKALQEILIPIDSDITAVSRPTVSKYKDGFLMLYSGKNAHGFYDIYAAFSENGKTWKPCQLELTGKREDWESNECTYPALFTHNNELYVLYNGNGYGATGFGLLKLMM